jgi:hypothetical protein
MHHTKIKNCIIIIIIISIIIVLPSLSSNLMNQVNKYLVVKTQCSTLFLRPTAGHNSQPVPLPPILRTYFCMIYINNIVPDPSGCLSFDRGSTTSISTFQYDSNIYINILEFAIIGKYYYSNICLKQGSPNILTCGSI